MIHSGHAIVLQTAVRENLKKEREIHIRHVHRTGIEPVPLAWKASMITTSPSVSNNATLKLCDIVLVSPLVQPGQLATKAVILLRRPYCHELSGQQSLSNL